MNILSFIKFTSKFKVIKEMVQTHLTVVVFFTIVYYILNLVLQDKGFHHLDNKNDVISLFDCFHFSLITQTTVGYGHILPSHIFTKIVNVLQLLTIYGVLVFDII